MKTLKDYVKLPRTKFKHTIHKIFKEEKNKYKLCECVVDSDYDKFLEMNNIDESSNDTYKEYIKYNFNNALKYDLCNINNRSYYLYQDNLYKHINETISCSFDSRELAEKISKKCNGFDFEFLSKKIKTQFSFHIKRNDLKTNSDKFFSLIHFYNYYVKTIIDIDDDLYVVHIEPYKPDDITDMIYNNFNGIIYHVTSRQNYNKIKKSELKPNKIDNGEMFRDGRIFFIAGNDINEIRLQLRSISNTSQIDEPVFLKIDLNKFEYNIRFRLDSSAEGYNAYFTEEPIPAYCIVETFSNWKDIK